jgi:hypothetical protein
VLSGALVLDGILRSSEGEKQAAKHADTNNAEALSGFFPHAILIIRGLYLTAAAL